MPKKEVLSFIFLCKHIISIRVLEKQLKFIKYFYYIFNPIITLRSVLMLLKHVHDSIFSILMSPGIG